MMAGEAGLGSVEKSIMRNVIFCVYICIQNGRSDFIKKE